MRGADASLQRMRQVLGKLIEVSEMTRVEIGERLGGGPHLVRRILAGDSELKVRHILEIAELIGIRPIEFFHIVFDGAPGDPSPLIKKLGAMADELGSYHAGAVGRDRGPARDQAGPRRRRQPATRATRSTTRKPG
jgi:hypothetical protein